MLNRPPSMLIVEDDRPTQTLLTAIAYRNHFRPRVCGDGRSALEQLRNDDYSVILLDLRLPDVDGAEVLRQLARTSPQLLGRVVVVTADTRGRYDHCPELRSVWCVLRKPFDLDALEAQIIECRAQAN